jgi:hypothetical protein
MPLTRPTASQVNFAVTDISDPLLRINSGETGTADKDAGIVIERGNDTNVALLWDESANEFGLVNTSESGSTSGNVTIASYANLHAGTVGVGEVSVLETVAITLATTTQTAIDTFSVSTYRSCKYAIQATNTVTSEYQVVEVLLIHNGSTAYITTYGTIYTGSAELATFAVDISSGSVRLLVTGASANSTQYKITRMSTVV